MTCNFSEVSTIRSRNCFGIRTQVSLTPSPRPGTEIYVCDLFHVRGGLAGALCPSAGSRTLPCPAPALLSPSEWGASSAARPSRLLP